MLLEIEVYLDEVDKFDFYSIEWDMMIFFFFYFDEDRGICYNFLKLKFSSFEDYIEYLEILQKLVMIGKQFLIFYNY